MQAQRGSRDKLYSFFNFCARWCGWSTPRPGLLYPRERPGTQCIGDWVGLRGRSGRVWKISPPTGPRSPDSPPHSESLYRLRYRGPQYGRCIPTFQRSLLPSSSAFPETSVHIYQTTRRHIPQAIMSCLAQSDRTAIVYRTCRRHALRPM